MDLRSDRSRARWAVVGLALAAALLVGACGGPAWTYVTNSEDRTYLRLPNSWRPIDTAELGAAIGLDPTVDTRQQGFWLAGYDASPDPSTAHLLGPHSEDPAMFVGVRDVPPSLRGQVSLDLLRDYFRPVSDEARQQASANPMSPYSGFGLIADEVLTPGDGLRGVHTVYQYRIQGGPAQVFDQTLYVNDDASKVFMLFVRCSTQCYEQRQSEITNVVSSFTVRENP
ncbi:hypothetical protein BJF78_29105 [Pseudonocardia sp. CNS-139]|nr:hypothetical protein BJF78_29105 [Pseudonocardia sp. CNS-139]